MSDRAFAAAVGAWGAVVVLVFFAAFGFPFEWPTLVGLAFVGAWALVFLKVGRRWWLYALQEVSLLVILINFSTPFEITLNQIAILLLVTGTAWFLWMVPLISAASVTRQSTPSQS